MSLNETIGFVALGGVGTFAVMVLIPLLAYHVSRAWKAGALDAARAEFDRRRAAAVKRQSEEGTDDE